MRAVFAIGLAFLVLTSAAFGEGNFKGRPITNNIGMPTGYTLNKGEFTVGLGPIGFGITGAKVLSTFYHNCCWLAPNLIYWVNILYVLRYFDQRPVSVLAGHS